MLRLRRVMLLATVPGADRTRLFLRRSIALCLVRLWRWLGETLCLENSRNEPLSSSFPARSILDNDGRGWILSLAHA